MLNVNFAILTVSDSASQGFRDDKSGPMLRRSIEGSVEFHGLVAYYKILPDNQEDITCEMHNLTSRKFDGEKVDIIVTTGGTGFSKRDVTPEATRAVIEKEANGLAFALFNKSLAVTKNAALSRLCAGICRTTLIVNFPGSTKAVQECWEVLEPLVNHIVNLLRENEKSVETEHNILQQKFSTCDCSKPLEFMADGSAVKVKSIAGRPRESQYPMISVDEACKIVESQCSTPCFIKKVNLEDCVDCVLAGDVFAQESVPPFAASVKDGYAVRAEDGAGRRKVTGVAEAGNSEEMLLQPGCCIRISTGAPIPKLADAVVQVEDTEISQEENGEELEIILKIAPNPFQDIREAGSDLTLGDCILKSGSTLNSSEIGLLASIGHHKVAIWTKPRLAVLSTGSELVECHIPHPLPPGKIRDSNGPMLKALLRQHGFDVHKVEVAQDDALHLTNQLTSLFSSSDVIVTSGGVSMGEKDMLKEVLSEAFKFQVHFGRVLMKPGKPTTFATGFFGGSKKLVFALPGNPVSAWVTAHLFVLPALKLLSGFSQPNFGLIKVKLMNDVWHLDNRPEFCRAKLVTSRNTRQIGEHSFYALILETNQISSRLLSNRNANLLLKLPASSPEKSSILEGDLIDALIIGQL